MCPIACAPSLFHSAFGYCVMFYLNPSIVDRWIKQGGHSCGNDCQFSPRYKSSIQRADLSTHKYILIVELMFNQKNLPSSVAIYYYEQKSALKKLGNTLIKITCSCCK